MDEMGWIPKKTGLVLFGHVFYSSKTVIDSVNIFQMHVKNCLVFYVKYAHRKTVIMFFSSVPSQ